MKASIEKGWHLYSQYILPDGPIPTSFKFTPGKDYKLAGKVKEGVPIKKLEPAFDNMELKFFENSAVFKQIIKTTSDKNFTVKGELEFMVCNETKCLPPEVIDFEFKIENSGKLTLEKEPSQISKDSLRQRLADDNLVTAETKDSAKTLIQNNIATTAVVQNTISSEKKSNWLVFILGFIGGLAALLTPCVFPMIPLTVSFFTKQAGSKKKGFRNASIYGLSIIAIYVALGLIISVSFGPDALNALSSNEWMNLAFFLIFVVFGISFLGAFEITLPSSWVNKADHASEKGGLVGIFFMAFTLSLVSFSCTGPIIGSLLVEAARGGYTGPILGMLGFSLALALPFTLFAAFPGWMHALPKSGGWLNNVKVVLGLLEIAFALKFLSIVDLAGLHIEWLHFNINGPMGILKREVFIALWIVIFSMLGLYLLGKIRFSHDSETKYVSIPKLLLSIITFAFVVYLIPGMWGAPLKLISGFPPPSFHSEGWNNSPASVIAKEEHASEGDRKIACPHNLDCFHDYDLALAYARKVGKPLMVDFTGWACVNCRKMEENVWIDPGVLQRLNIDFVLVSLYVDDKTELPENQKYVSPTTNKNVKTIGNKWSDLQTKRFDTNSQPYYVLLDNEEKELTEPRGYDSDVEKYIQFLDEGKAEFGKRNSSLVH